MGLTTWWSAKRQTLTLGMLAMSMAGKGLALLAVGALWADAIRPWAWSSTKNRWFGECMGTNPWSYGIILMGQ